jgi:hypothetical protein
MSMGERWPPGGYSQQREHGSSRLNQQPVHARAPQLRLSSGATDNISSDVQEADERTIRGFTAYCPIPPRLTSPQRGFALYFALHFCFLRDENPSPPALRLRGASFGWPAGFGWAGLGFGRRAAAGRGPRPAPWYARGTLWKSLYAKVLESLGI